jgi:hypothetical protein
VTACLALWATASYAGGVTVSHYEPLERLSGPSVSGQPKPAAVLTFDAFGKAFELALLPNDRLLAPAARQMLTGDAALYRGTLAGKPGSWVRIVMAGGMPRGLIWDGAEMYAVEAPGDTALNTSAPVIYRLSDTYIPPGTLSCAAPAVQANAAVTYGKLVGELGRSMAKAPGASLQIDIGAVGDFEFFLDQGENAEAAILTRLNNVDGIYSEQLGVQINVAELQVFDHPFDPFSDERDARDLLDELSDYRSAVPAQRRQGLTHLYTGRNLAGNTVGIAYTGALCQPFFGTGLSQGSHSATFDSLVAAHEIGHNFGAPHDGDADAACAAVPPTFLMATELNGSDEFSQCSIAQIQPNIASAPCIFELPSVDMTVAFDRKLQPVLLGNEVTVRFVATNIGTEQATNVGLEVELPETVSLAPDQAACSSEGGSLRCAIGTVASGGATTTALKLVATDIGTGDLVATISSDADFNGGNNRTALPLTVLPAVDLVVNGIAAAQAGLNQQTSVVVELENRSQLRATGVELSVALGNGLRAESAAWALGPCTVMAQQVRCAADRFGAQFSVVLELELTGTAAGQSSYVVSVGAVEDDANEADNSATGTVTIAAPAASQGGSGSSGGGGAAGFVFLSLLGCAALARRRFSNLY